jgi:hypothetical protein
MTPYRNKKLEKKLKISTEMQEAEAGTFKEAEKKVHADLVKLDQSKAVIVPFLISISEKDHAYIIENWLMSCLPESVREELE